MGLFILILEDELGERSLHDKINTILSPLLSFRNSTEPLIHNLSFSPLLYTGNLCSIPKESERSISKLSNPKNLWYVLSFLPSATRYPVLPSISSRKGPACNSAYSSYYPLSFIPAQSFSFFIKGRCAHFRSLCLFSWFDGPSDLAVKPWYFIVFIEKVIICLNFWEGGGFGHDFHFSFLRIDPWIVSAFIISTTIWHITEYWCSRHAYSCFLPCSFSKASSQFLSSTRNPYNSCVRS